MRKVLTIVSIIIVLAGLGVVGYFYFFNQGPKITVGQPTPRGALPASKPIPVAPLGSTTPSVVAPVATTQPRLVQISKGPVVLGEAVTTTVGTASTSPETTVTYIERQSGNVYTYNTSTGASVRTSNKTLPGIQFADWLPSASTAFVRYLSGTDFSTTNTYALHSNGSEGFFLPQNISDIAVSSTSVLTLASGVNGSVASVAHTDGTHATQVFTTPLSALRASFAGPRAYLAFTKPSSTLAGTAYLIDGTGTFTRVAGPATGLVAKASPSGKWLIVSSANSGTLLMSLVNTQTNESLPLPVATIVDKCVWALDDSAVYCAIPAIPPIANYPDDWYQGAVSFSDKIWKIQVSGRYAQFVLDFTKETKTPLDAESLALDPSSRTIVFVNKIDESLWAYSL